MSTGFATPAWQVVLNNTDITPRIAPRLLELRLSEKRNGEADQIELHIHDHDQQMALPRRGVSLSVAMGTTQSGLITKGRFHVDEVEYSGAPDIITIRGRSAALTGNLRIRRSGSWHQTTVGAVLQQVVARNQLTLRIEQRLAATPLAHLDQTNESDIALVSRLGKRFDAVATVKAGALLFAPIGSGKSLSGKDLPTVTIDRSDGDHLRWIATDRDKYSGVRAYYITQAGLNRKSVLVGHSGHAKRLERTYASREVAAEHAQAEWQRIQRGVATLQYTLAIGRADIYPEMHLRVTGCKPEINNTPWIVASTVHTISSHTGLTTELELETLGRKEPDQIKDDNLSTALQDNDEDNADAPTATDDD